MTLTPQYKGFLRDTVSMIMDQKDNVIPIISNSFRIEQIFQEERVSKETSAEPQQHGDIDRTIEELLTKKWALSEAVQYPMPDTYNLAQIAQYHQVETKNNFQAKADYTNFLKEDLLAKAGNDKDYRDLVDIFAKKIDDLRFSEIVRQLDYPRLTEGQDDPLRLLAKLPLPIYITTSYYNFLEQALEAENKTPETGVCFWEGGNTVGKTGQIKEPSPSSPLVYHLFGLEDNPQTMVMSEDDYMKFLVSMAKDDNTQQPILPLTLRSELANRRLLLLGYQLRDWDFRVLFRFIASIRLSSHRGIVIQLQPDHKRIGDAQKAHDYLSDYFDRQAFHFEWMDTASFVQSLWKEWKNRS
jgi:SIR2-like domain